MFSFMIQVEVPAPPVVQPLPDLSVVPPVDTPEAAFDMIAAANLQPAATLDLDSAPEPEAEEPAAADLDPDLEDDLLTGELEENVEQVVAEGEEEAEAEVEEEEKEEEKEEKKEEDEEAEGEEIPLDEVQLNHPAFIKLWLKTMATKL